MLTNRLEEAVRYVAAVHADQVRKGTNIPYISHLLLVAGTVLDHGGDEDEAVAALLHDAPEDRGGERRLLDIRVRFGERVANIVEGCSDTFEHPKPPVDERRRRYLEHLRLEQDISILPVSASDKLTNARAILRDFRTHGDAVFERFSAGKDGTLNYYRDLATIFLDKRPLFQPRDGGALVRDLDAVVGELLQEGR